MKNVISFKRFSFFLIGFSFFLLPSFELMDLTKQLQYA